MHARGKAGWTALHIAACGDPNVPDVNPEIFELVLRHGIDIDARDDLGFTALHTTAVINKKAAVKLLINLGANVEARDNTGRTPLIRVCIEGFVEIAKTLIEEGHANIAARSNDGSHPIVVAARKGYRELVQYLLSKS